MKESQSEHFYSLSEKTEYFYFKGQSIFRNQLNNMTLLEFSNIFLNTENNYNPLENENIDEIRISSIIENKKTFNKLFEVKKEISLSGNNSTEYTRKKRGRKKERENKSQTHDKYWMDNMLRKIQNHFLSFIIFFINDILEALNYKQRFLKLDQTFKINIKKDFVESLKKKTIAEIIDNKISTKYKKKIDNKKIYEELKDKEDLKVLFKENYLVLFKNIYYENKKIINLKKYGIEKEIKLSKEVKFYEDLLKKEAFNEDNEYIRNINECINLNFLS